MLSSEVSDLKISEYLTSGENLDSLSLQDTLIIAIKREQQSIDFYSRLMSFIQDKIAKRMCEDLVHGELSHKMRLEIFYDDYYYGEN
jgi:rubrerythrin